MQDTMPKRPKVRKMSRLNWYELVFRQISPLHMGKYHYGVISETEIFIPGHTMWGALVNYIGSNYANGESRAYEQEKENYKRITCFYPSFEGTVENILFPKFEMFSELKEFERGILYYGGYSEGDLRRTLCDTWMSTAVNATDKSAKDASLHEMEVVIPKTKDKNQSVFWTGLLGLPSSEAKNTFQRFIEETPEIIVGGDSRYGLGRIRLEEAREVDCDMREKWQVNEDGVFQNDGKSIKNYIKTEAVSLNYGKYKTIIQLNYDHSKGRPTINRQNINVCFLPGSTVKTSVPHVLERGVFQSMNTEEKL